MARRRSAALRDTAGVHHVASGLALEGFRPTPATDGTAADVLVGPSDGTSVVPLAVRTSECPPGFGEERDAVTCEWRVGRGLALVGDRVPFVALVDLGRSGWSPRVWVAPSGETCTAGLTGIG